MLQSSGRLPRSRRLRESRDFKRVSRLGNRVASPHFVLLTTTARPPGALGSGRELSGVGKESVPGLRLGITVSRSVGNAVTRNRVKRQIRSWFRNFSSDYPSFFMDLVVIARKSASSLQSEAVFSHLNKLATDSLKNAGHDHHGG